MSTATKERELQLIPADKIAEVAGFNPRGDFSRDDEAFLSLKASIAERGIESPIKVGPADDKGVFPIIFGHRRHAVALELGIDVPAEVDASLDEKQRFLAALAENRARAEMSPVAEARALKVLRDDFKMKQKDAADAMAMSERSARNRERILDVPESLQALVNAGELPLEAVVHLAAIAKVRATAVERIVEKRDLAGLADKNEVGLALESVASEVGLQQIAAHDHEQIHPNAIGVDSDFRKKLKKLWEGIPTPSYNKPLFHFGDKDAEAAKQAGSLLEFTFERWGSKRTARFITDPELTFELAKLKIPAMDKEARRLIAQQGSPGGSVEPNGDAAKQREQEEKKRQREAATFAKSNAELGDRLAALKNPKPTDLDVIRLVCAMALGDEDSSAEVIAAGLGELAPDTYSWGADEDAERFPDKVVAEELAAAKTPGECLKVVLRVAIARTHVLGSIGHGWALQGPHSGDPLDVTVMVDDIAERLGLLPAPAVKKVKERRKEAVERAKRLAVQAKEAEERAKAAAEEAEAAEQESTQYDRVVELIEAEPGIAASNIATKMKVKPNHLYRILGDLEKEGRVKKDGRTYTVVADAKAGEADAA